MQLHAEPPPFGESLKVHHRGLRSHLAKQVQGLDLVMEYKVSSIVDNSLFGKSEMEW